MLMVWKVIGETEDCFIEFPFRVTTKPISDTEVKEYIKHYVEDDNCTIPENEIINLELVAVRSLIDDDDSLVFEEHLPTEIFWPIPNPDYLSESYREIRLREGDKYTQTKGGEK